MRKQILLLLESFFEYVVIMITVFTDEQKALITNDLLDVLSSQQFANAPVLRMFLEYIVNETISGRSEHIKAYTIAVEALGKDLNFDPTSDTSVRTSAGRLRKTLQAYYEARDTPPVVMIRLPAGRYVPSFEIRSEPATPEPQAPIVVPPVSRRLSVSGVLLAIGGIIIAVLGLITFLVPASRLADIEDVVVITIHPVEHTNDQLKLLAREIEIHLAPALARIKMAQVIPPSRSAASNENSSMGGDADNRIAFSLNVSITGQAEDHHLLWKLTDPTTSRIVWTSQERLPDTGDTAIDMIVDKIAFQILGAGGAVASTLKKQKAQALSRSACLFRAQIQEEIDDHDTFAQLQACLENITSVSPGNATAWAILSNFYTIRSFTYAGGAEEDRLKLVHHAEQAAEKAVQLDPRGYLTKIALMQLAFRQRQLIKLEALEQEIRIQYPGDAYHHIRIATRIARLGRGQEALEIFNNARNEFGMHLKNWAPGVSMAYFVEGDYEAAYRQLQWSPSNQRSVLVLNAAILGKLGRQGEAEEAVRRLVESNPDIRKTYYGWLTDVGWAEAVVLDIADGLAKAGLVVDVHSVNLVTPKPVSG